MKMTLLAMVQNILTDMNSDNVNNITDTVESEQVANIIKNTYISMCSKREIPYLFLNLSLNASGNYARKSVLKVPENVAKVEEVIYNNKKVEFLYPDEFLKLMRSRNESPNTIKLIEPSGLVLYIQTNKDPSYCTSFDDSELIFDSFDLSTSDTLVASKSLIYAQLTPVFEMSNDFIPKIPTHIFPQLLETAKSISFLNVKQMPNAAIEKNALELKAYNSRMKRVNNNGIRTPNYGRK